MIKQLINDVKKGFNSRFLLVLCVFIVLFILFINVPGAELGFIPGTVTSIISSHPAYTELTSGLSLSQDRVVDQVEEYIDYYKLVIYTVSIGVISSIVFWLILTTMCFNLLLHKKASLKHIWKHTLMNLFIVLIFFPMLVMVYAISLFLSTLISNMSDYAGNLFSVLSGALIFILFLHIIFLLAYKTVKTNSIKKAFVLTIDTTKNYWKTLLSYYVVAIVFFLIITAVSTLFYTYQMVASLFIMLSVVIPLAWASVMVHNLVEKNQSHSQKRRRK